MKNENTIGFAVLGFVVLVAIGFFMLPMLGSAEAPDKTNTNSNNNNNNINAEAGFESIITGTTSPGDVSIELKPHQPANGVLEVDLYANTHSVDLSQFDLAEITSLEYEGKSVKPVSAPSMRGHHVSGTLAFEVDEELESFKITISGIPDVEERIYEWGEN